MMIPFRPQFFNFPFNNFYNYRPPNYYTYNPNHNQKNTSYNTMQGYNSNESKKNFDQNNSNFLHENSHHSTQGNNFSQKEEPQGKNESSTYDSDEYFFELFGLKLYFDDVLLICLLFFLYQEGVKDQELFISLILLLLS